MAEATFTCGLCDCDYPLEERVFVFPNHHAEGSMCRDCIIQSFHNAYDSTDDPDLSWGVEWASGYVRARDHVSLLGEDFVAKYELLEAEYDVLRRNRVYCPHPTSDPNKKCDTFIGSVTRDADSRASCPTCHRSVCMKCRQPHGNDHPQYCSDLSQDDDSEVALPQNWIRAQDYQLCPQCRNPVQHLELCNFVRCPLRACRTGFCFICGQIAQHRHPYLHWQRFRPNGSDGCYLWGGKGPNDPATAMYANVEDQPKYYRIDMPTLKTHLSAAVSQQKAVLRIPNWIRDMSNDWNVVFRYAEGMVSGICAYQLDAPRPQTTLRELNLLASFDKYLNYADRFFYMWSSIEANARDRMVEVARPAQFWSQELHDIANSIPIQEREMYELKSMNVVEFFLYINRRGANVKNEWTRHVPRSMQILYWVIPSESNSQEASRAGRSVIFTTLKCEYEPSTHKIREAMFGLEALLLKSPQWLLSAAFLSNSVNGNPALLPPPPPGLRVLQYSHATVKLSTILAITRDAIDHAVMEADDDAYAPPSIPEWWKDPPLPGDTEVVVKYVQDGQATKAFEKAEVVALFVHNGANWYTRDALLKFCCHMKSLEQSDAILCRILCLGDISILTDTVTVTDGELDRPGMGITWKFDGHRLV